MHTAKNLDICSKFLKNGEAGDKSDARIDENQDFFSLINNYLGDLRPVHNCTQRICCALVPGVGRLVTCRIRWRCLRCTRYRWTNV